MQITTTFITRYVADHEASTAWYTDFLGRTFDATPMASCHEWHLPGGVAFQVIHDPGRAGTQSFAFAVEDLASQEGRLAGAGVETGPPWDVDGFDGLRYVPAADPEGVETGLLTRAG